MRLFFAIELPHQIQAALGRLKPPDDGSRDYRWVDPALLHITLAFLGEQPTEKLETLEHLGRQAARISRSGQLTLGEAGSFGAKRAPRVLWVDLAGDVEALLQLQRNLDTALRSAGFPLEERAFRPHVTLARRREAAHGGPSPGWPPAINRQATAFAMSKLTLMQSRLSSRGPTYTPVFEFPVGS